MKKMLLALMGLILAPAATAAPYDAPNRNTPPFGIDPDLPLNRVTWLTAHNAFNNGRLLPNQTHSIQRQLELGVHGLMLDLHESGGKLYLCHGTCIGATQTFASVLQDTILPFLHDRPETVLSIHLEDYETREQLIRELSQVQGLSELSFDPQAWTTPEWPTYRQLLESGQRLLIFTQKVENSGALPTSSGPVHVMYDRYYTVENYWSLGNTMFQHDNSCVSRWNGVPLHSPTVATDKGWPRLFVMNHFHGLVFGGHAETDNTYDALRDRIDSQCEPAANRRPNTIAVDQYQAGQARSVVAALNAGTLELFDGLDGTGHRICAIHAGWKREVTLNRESPDLCTPYARSAVLRDVPAGTTYELDDGNTGGPRVFITADRDLGGESVTIRDLETDQDHDGVRVRRDNGGTLSQRVYRARVHPAR